MSGTKTDFLALAQQLAPELSAIRHALHRRPELGNSEYRTRETLERALAGCGVSTEHMLDTGLVGTLRFGRSGKTAALRADMDALPISEQTGADFASCVPGVMHACGHDIHMTAAVGAAMLLSKCSDALSGCLKLFFQPDEEGCGGAKRMIDAGCLHLPEVDAVFGAHVSSELPVGSVGFRPGKLHAASNTFTVTVKGLGAHGAEPEKGRDALYAAAEMVCQLKKLREELISRFGKTIITVGCLQSGTAGNIIADNAVFSGIIRTLGPVARAESVRCFIETVTRTAEKCGVTAECAMRESYPGIVNDEEITLFARRETALLLGEDQAVLIPEPTMSTEDFGYFLEKVPGSFYHIGVGGDYPLHNPRFLPDDSVLPYAAAVHAAIIAAFLSK